MDLTAALLEDDLDVLDEVDEPAEFIALSDREADSLRQLLKTESSCYSLWIIMSDGNRTTYELVIADNSARERAEQSAGTESFDEAGTRSTIGFRW